MLLSRFKASKIHGYLNFDIRISRHLNFLTGINGSGKTSVLHSIVSLITPQLNAICDLEYESIRIEFKQDTKSEFIQANKNGQSIEIFCSASEEKLTIQKYIPDPETPPYKEYDYQQEYYRETFVAQSRHPVLSFISGLPTPMFLGLDRRGQTGNESPGSRPPPTRTARIGRNIFSASLSRSLSDAALLAETNYRDRLIAAARVGDELRRETLLTLLAFEPVENMSMIAIPNAKSLQELRLTRNIVSFLPNLLGLPKEDIESRIVPFLDLLERVAEKLRDIRSPEQIFLKDKIDEDLFRASAAWSFNSPQLKKIKVVTEILQSYDGRFRKISEPSERYLELINRFLGDSGKEVCFDDSGYIYIRSNYDELKRPLSSLSSGEAQIFVIITHLFFNVNAQKANVFIIDEPELSLHVQWQEKFVESVMSANPKIQYLMATHSPSIILDKVERCIDLSAVKKSRNRA